MLNGLPALVNAKILPSITSMSMEVNEKTVLNLIFQFNTKFDKNSLPWLQRQTIKFFKFKVCISFSKNKSEAFRNKPELLLTNSADLISDEFLKIEQEPVLVKNSEGEFLAFSISKQLETTRKEINDLSVFWVLYLDNNAIAEAHKVSPSLFKKTFFTSLSEEFIVNGKLVNNKLHQNIPVSISSDGMAFTDTINHDRVHSKIFSLPLYTSTSKLKRGTFIFFIDLQEMMKEKSIFSQFNGNKIFTEDYFNSPINNKPKKLLVTKKNEIYQEILYNDSYSSYRETEKCVIEEIRISSTKFAVIFTDKFLDQSKVFQFEFKFFFEDNTLEYLQKLTRKLEKNSSNLEQINNIANYGNYYISQLKRFDARFFDVLKRKGLDLQEIANNFSFVVSRLFKEPPARFADITFAIKNKNITPQFLGQILNFNYFLLSQLTRIQNEFLSISSSLLELVNVVENDIEMTQRHLHTDILIKENPGIQKISMIEFSERIKKEISKFFKDSDVNIVNKFTYFSPNMISTNQKQVNCLEQKTHEINFMEFTKMFINFLQESSLTLPFLEEVFSCLGQFGLSVYRSSTIIKNDPSQLSFSEFIAQVNDSILNDEDVQFILPILLSLIIKDDLFFLTALQEQNNESVLSEGLINSLPLQLQAVYQGYKETGLVNLSRDGLRLTTNKIIGFLLNFKTLFELQYLESLDCTKSSWKTLTFMPKSTLICRWVPYVNEQLKIKENKDLPIRLNNEIFLLTV